MDGQYQRQFSQPNKLAEARGRSSPSFVERRLEVGGGVRSMVPWPCEGPLRALRGLCEASVREGGPSGALLDSAGACAALHALAKGPGVMMCPWRALARLKKDLRNPKHWPGDRHTQ